MVEAAQMAVKSDPLLKRRFQELQHRMHRNPAIVTIAHHLLELVWYVLTRREPYRHFSEEKIAYKYLSWAWRMTDEARDGLTRQQFARYYLMRLGIGHDLNRVALDPKHPRRLASEADLLILCIIRGKAITENGVCRSAKTGHADQVDRSMPHTFG